MSWTQLRKIIPVKELQEKFASGDSELGWDFLGFEENYHVLAELLPKHFTVVDMGCYQAAQCYLFQDFKAYVGVDIFDNRLRQHGYRPPERFAVKNTTHFICTIQDFLLNYKKRFDPETTYYIASAVPDFIGTDMMLKQVKNGAVVYPGEMPKTKGILAEELKAAYMSLLPQCL